MKIRYVSLALGLAVVIFAACLLFLSSQIELGYNGNASSPASVPASGPDQSASGPPLLASRVPHSTAVSQPVGAIRGRCVDILGRPLAGCTVVVKARPGTPGRIAAWQLQKGAFCWQSPNPVTSHVDGTFALSVAPTGPWACSLIVSAPNHVETIAHWPEILGGNDYDLGDIVLRSAVTVRLHVVDSSGNNAASVVLVFVREEPSGQLSSSSGALVSLHTDAQGRCQDVFAVGTYTLTTSSDNRARDFQVPESAFVLERQIVVSATPARRSIRGRVVSIEGIPIPGAAVFLGPFASNSPRGFRGPGTITVKDGTFLLAQPQQATAENVELHCTAPGYHYAQTPTLVAWGASGVDIVLSRAACLEIHVAAANAGPVERYSLLAWTQQDVGRSQQFHSRGFHPDGIAHLDDLPYDDYWLSVMPDDTSICPSHCLPLRIDKEFQVKSISLSPTACRTLKVVGDTPSLVSGTQFEVLDPLISCLKDGMIGHLTVASPLQTWVTQRTPNCALLLQVGMTDSLGEAVLRGPSDRPVVVRLPGGRSAPLLRYDVSLSDPVPLVVVVSPGSVLRGRVLPAALLRSATSCRILLRWLDPSGPPVAGPPERSELLPTDGTFQFAGLPPGTWQVMFSGQLPGTRTSVYRQLETIAIDNGAVIERDYDLAALVPGRICGSIALDGVVNQSLALDFVSLDDRRRIQDCQVSPEGKFDISMPAGRYRVVVRLQDLAFEVGDPVQIETSQLLERSLVIWTGRLRLQLRDRQDRPVPSVIVSIHRADGTLRTHATTDDSGCIDIRLEAGILNLRVVTRSLQATAGKRRETVPKSKILDLGSVCVSGSAAWHCLMLPAQWFD